MTTATLNGQDTHSAAMGFGPAALDAEARLAAAVLFRPDAIVAHVRHITPAMFSDDRYRALARYGLDALARDGRVDPAAVAEQCFTDGLWTREDLAAVLNDLDGWLPLASEWHVGRAVDELLERRRNLDLSGTLASLRSKLDAGEHKPDDTLRGLDELRERCKPASQQQFTFKSSSQLAEGLPTKFIGPIHGILTAGCSTQFSSLPKCGKSTAIAWMIGELDRAGLSVLVVSEEAERHWVRRRDQYGYGDGVQFLCRPFKRRPDRAEWESLIRHVADECPAVAIFDTLANLWCCEKENEADHAIPALAPLVQIMEAGSALLLSHHAGKADRGEGMASRGSNSIPGWFDIVAELRRTNPNGPEDGLRTINTWGKFDECPPEVVIERVGHGFKVLGQAHEVRACKRLDTIKGILDRRGPDAWIAIDLMPDEWPEGVKQPSERQLREDLAEGWRKDLWRRQGRGIRNDPFLFSCKQGLQETEGVDRPLSFPAPLRKGCAGNEMNGFPAKVQLGADDGLQEMDGIPI